MYTHRCLASSNFRINLNECICALEVEMGSFGGSGSFRDGSIVAMNTQIFESLSMGGTYELGLFTRSQVN
jgi:hypothetical protein